MKKYCLLIVILAMTQFVVNAIDIKQTLSEKKAPMLQLDNRYLRLKLLPGNGGRVKSLYFKPVKKQLVDSANGALTDNVWNIPSSRFFLRGKPYLVTDNKSADSVEVEMKGNAQGGGIDFLEVSKTVKLLDDSAAVTVDYSLRNMPQAMAALDYGFWFHNVMGVVGEKATCYYPTTQGIMEVPPEQQHHDRWFYRPARGWLAAGVPNGAGIAAVMDYAWLKCFYSWYENTTVPTLEWRFEKMTLKENESFSTRIQLIPFFGLPSVSGAGHNVVGSLIFDEDVEVGGSMPIEIALYSAVKQDVTIDLTFRHLPDGKWISIGTKELVFNAPATVQRMSCQFKPPVEGGYALEAIICSGKQELARLNRFVVCGESDAAYSLQPLVEKIKPTEQKVDLTKFDFSRETPHIKWAKPYSQGTIKVLGLTGYQNMREVAELAQRLDIEPHVTFLCVGHRPIYLVGDDYGRTTQADIMDNLNKQLKKDYDVIIIGGVPWDYFPKSARVKMLAKINAGTGLVYIDPNSATPGLRKVSPLFERKGTISGIPQATQNSFLTAGIPFRLFPKHEINKYQCDGKILAEVGTYPYLATRQVGKGRVVALAYRALTGFRYNNTHTGPGLTPDLRPSRSPELTDHYWEYFYSLLAKCVIYAADRLPPVLIKEFAAKVQGEIIKIDLQIESNKKCDASLAITNYNRYSELLNQKKQHQAIQKGINKLQLTLPAAVFAGRQTVNVIIRDNEQNVLNWGTVGVRNEPSVRLTQLVLDKAYYQHGETAEVGIKTAGSVDESLMIRCELYDSYQRCLFRSDKPAGNAVFQIPLINQLLARRYHIKAGLFCQERQVDGLIRKLVVTPTAKQLVWDDFEPGVWLTTFAGLGVREHLWPLLADRLHRLSMKTVIANFAVLDNDFAVDHNFHPTALQHLGLSRCAEPVDYVKTGDKLKLIRKPCLSDPMFINKIKHCFKNLGNRQKKYGLRFYWVGDEQSITGYNGTPIDFCFSTHCLAKFRAQLQEQYQTLQHLNRAWSTDFKTWNDVLPMTRQEVWKRGSQNAAPWADHLNFMDSRLEAMVKMARDSCKQADPNTQISISGTQPPTAYGGMDWWRQMKHFDGIMNYHNGGQRDLQRSFKPNAGLMNWALGYSRRGGRVCFDIWQSLFIGEKGVMGFHAPSMVNPDMTFSIGAKDSLESLKLLTQGIGKHYINNLKPCREIAILYSQASIRAAFINKKRELHNDLRMKYISLCRNTGVSFDFISYEQLAAGILKKRGYKALILPNSTALSQAECDEITDFSQAGGVVIGEELPGRLDEHCRTRDKNELTAIFDNQKAFLIPQLNTDYLGALLYPGSIKNSAILRLQQQQFLSRLQAAAIKPSVIITDEKGRQIRHAEIYNHKDSHDNSYIGIIINDKKDKQVTITFAGNAHVYDMRTGRYFGYTNQAKLFLADNKPYAFALLKQQPGDLQADLTLNGKTVSVNIAQQGKLDNVINLSVVAPDGTPVACYNQNMILKNGSGTTIVPFALNDKAGEWTIKLKNVISGQTVIKTVNLE